MKRAFLCSKYTNVPLRSIRLWAQPWAQMLCLMVPLQRPSLQLVVLNGQQSWRLRLMTTRLICSDRQRNRMQHKRPRKGGAGALAHGNPSASPSTRTSMCLVAWRLIHTAVHVMCRTTEEMTLLEVPLVINPGDEDEDGDEDEEAEDEAEGAAGKAPRRSRSGILMDALDMVPLTGGGLLVREPLPPREQASWTVVSDERPTAEELRDLVFGWRLLPHLPHGAIVLCVERQMISPAYTWADQAQGVELALRVAGAAANGAILACDGPLTSTSAVELAAAGGVVAIVQPGGAARDSAL